MPDKLYRFVLLVDDDADDQLLFNDAIHNVDSSIHFDWADNGLHALNKLRANRLRPDLIFVDLNMPIINGFEFLTQIKKDSQLNNIPVVAFTTSDSKRDAERAHKLGANAFLTKPNSYKELCTKLRNILGTHLSDTAREYTSSDYVF